jgi:hypothetical protein
LRKALSRRLHYIALHCITFSHFRAGKEKLAQGFNSKDGHRTWYFAGSADQEIAGNQWEISQSLAPYWGFCEPMRCFDHLRDKSP